MSSTLTPYERVIRAITSLQKPRPFFSYILGNFDIVEESKVPTMAVDVKGKLYFNPEFITLLEDSELEYVMCHEVMHIATGTFWRQGTRDGKGWNIASDLAINDILNQEGMHGPKNPELSRLVPSSNGTVDLDFPGKKPLTVRERPAEDLYNELMTHIDKVKIKLKIKRPGQKGKGKGQGQGQGEGSGQGDSQDGEEGESDGHGGFDQHYKNGNQEDGSNNGTGEGNTDETGALSGAMQQAEAKWKRVTVQAATLAKQRGNLPGFAETLVEGLLNPKIDWKTYLRNYITPELPHDYCNRRPNRTYYGTGVWSPVLKKELVNVFISIDCSGSTSGSREEFVSECMGILLAHPQVKARLICWDTRIDERNDWEIATDTLDKLKAMRIQDVNGGTCFTSYADYLKEKGYKSRIHIVLTDGYIENEPKVPDGRLLFVLCGQSTDEIVKKYGDVIRLEK